jgi:hypothetical protein
MGFYFVSVNLETNVETRRNLQDNNQCIWHEDSTCPTKSDKENTKILNSVSF